jgi:hypothetical protein
MLRKFLGLGSILNALYLLALSSCTPIGERISSLLKHDAATAPQSDGEAPECMRDGDCRADVCGEPHCETGHCTTELKTEGTELGADMQMSGDCRKKLCSADGTPRDVPDDTDSPSNDSNPCHVQRCLQGESKTENAPDGTACNGTGQCKAGSCSTCGEGSDCSRPGDCTMYRIRCTQGVPSCEDTHEPRVDKRCMSAPPPSCEGMPNDGAACGDSAACHAGACMHNALINGDFSRGLAGWTLQGDAERFTIAPDISNYQRISLSTSTADASSIGAAQGAVSQTFIVPMDAIAIRFVVFGGHAHVRLKTTSGEMLQSCVGLDTNSVHVPVSWDLTGKRGQSLVIAIEDDLIDGDWAYVSTTGFDIVREDDSGILNSQFSNGLASWEASGDAQYFQIFEDFNYTATRNALKVTGDPSYGRRHSVTTYTVDRLASGYGEASKGILSQTFVVPGNAVALRFNVHGGRAGQVTLKEGDRALYTVSANNSDEIKTPVS